MPNTEAHRLCGDYLAAHLARFGRLTEQRATLTAFDGTVLNARNIICEINPDSARRILLLAHWDCRPWADNDPIESNRRRPVPGANDGASAIGVMLELARQISLAPDTADIAIGVDFICWDAEDSGMSGGGDSNSWCLGSQYWSGKRHADGYTARYGINLDMVGGDNTVFYREQFSMAYAPAIVDKVWAAAQRIGQGKYFSYEESGGAVTDDHLQVIQGGILCIDVIGSDREDGGFPRTWHTVNDNMQNISKSTLKAVGQTMLEVIWTER